MPNKNSPNSAVIPFEWFCDTLNKRIGAPYFLNISDLFLVVPFKEEAEFEFEISNIFTNQSKLAKQFGVAQGNNLAEDYPNLSKLINSSNKKITIRVFFVNPSRLQVCLVLWHKKYPYPKVSQVNNNRMKLVFEDTDVNLAVKEHQIKERLLSRLN